MIRSKLLNRLPEEQVPTPLVIRNIMKQTFNLKYKTVEKANTKYRDPDYNEKRIWVCRLLAQFMAEDAVIISLDESNFKHDVLPKKQWQFNSAVLEPKVSLLTKRKNPHEKIRPLSVLFATDE
jgi:hypothetical protein